MITYSGRILGRPLWLPVSTAFASLEIEEFEACSDAEAEDQLRGPRAGDFSEVIDVEVWRHRTELGTAPDGRITEITERQELIKRFRPAAEDLFRVLERGSLC